MLLAGAALAGAGCRDHGSSSVANRLLACDLLTQGKLEARPPSSARAACSESCESAVKFVVTGFCILPG